MYNCIPNNDSGNKSHNSTQWAVASFIQGVFHLPCLWLKLSNWEKHNCWIMPRNQAMFRGRKENGFQLILVDASFKKKEIIQFTFSRPSSWSHIPRYEAYSGVCNYHFTDPPVLSKSSLFQCHTSPNSCHYLLSLILQDSLRMCISSFMVTAVIHILL